MKAAWATANSLAAGSAALRGRAKALESSAPSFPRGPPEFSFAEPPAVPTVVAHPSTRSWLSSAAAQSCEQKAGQRESAGQPLTAPPLQGLGKVLPPLIADQMRKYTPIAFRIREQAQSWLCRCQLQVPLKGEREVQPVNEKAAIGGNQAPVS